MSNHGYDNEKCPECAGTGEDIKQLKAEETRLRGWLEAIIAWPDEKYNRRDEDGYPTEIEYDEFSYRRLVDSYRDALRRALAGEEVPK